MEIKERLKYLDEEISKLKSEQRELLEKDDDEFLERAKVHVGRCFCNDDKTIYVKVIGIPQVEYTMLSRYLNRYQFPAIFIAKHGDDLVPFYTDNFFSGAWGEGRNPRIYHEIPKEEFDAAFMQVLHDFQARVLSFGAEEGITWTMK